MIFYSQTFFPTEGIETYSGPKKIKILRGFIIYFSPFRLIRPCTTGPAVNYAVTEFRLLRRHPVWNSCQLRQRGAITQTSVSHLTHIGGWTVIIIVYTLAPSPPGGRPRNSACKGIRTRGVCARAYVPRAHSWAPLLPTRSEEPLAPWNSPGFGQVGRH